MLALWQSIPSQLSKDNKKFIYKNIKEGATSKDYEIAMQWLNDCGLIYKINKISKPYFPINSYVDNASFKLFMVDIGLLSALCYLNSEIIINNNNIFTEFKGSLTEQFVLQELKTHDDLLINYWTNNNGNAEIDFIIQKNKFIIPIEVKATINLQAKSLKVYNETFKPEIAIRTSLADYKQTNNNLYDVPLYAVSEFVEEYC
jgi:predicted AAA+ superfamily ATPase